MGQYVKAIKGCQQYAQLCQAHANPPWSGAAAVLPGGRRPRLHTLSKFFLSSIFAVLQQHVKLIKLVENLSFWARPTRRPNTPKECVGHGSWLDLSIFTRNGSRLIFLNFRAWKKHIIQWWWSYGTCLSVCPHLTSHLQWCTNWDSCTMIVFLCEVTASVQMPPTVPPNWQRYSFNFTARRRLFFLSCPYFVIKASSCLFKKNKKKISSCVSITVFR